MVRNDKLYHQELRDEYFTENQRVAKQSPLTSSQTSSLPEKHIFWLLLKRKNGQISSGYLGIATLKYPGCHPTIVMTWKMLCSILEPQQTIRLLLN